MRLFSQLSSVSGAGWRADAGGDPFAGLYNGFVPPAWVSALSSAGIVVTPELAMTLSAFYSGVSMIASDIATLPLQMFRRRQDDGKDRVRGSSSNDGGIGQLAYKLRWAPNHAQTASEFMMGQVAAILMREVCYAEIIPSERTGFVDQLLPRHPDRVRQERLPTGRMRFRLSEPGGQTRILTQDEMWVVRGLSVDGGQSPMSRVTYGANAIGTALATQRAAGRFFKSGMTASMLATYEGEKSDEEEAALHGSISRYAAGVDNSFGLMLVPDDIKVQTLAIEPEKAQMMQAREMSVREVCQLLRIPGYKMGLKDAAAPGSQIQGAIDYVIGTLRPPSVMIEQSIQRDLIVAKDTYFAEFLLEALLRGDPESQAKFIAEMIRFRVMRPSEARVILNMNPDEDLDRLSAADFRPGESSGSRPDSGGSSSSNDNGGRRSGGSRALLRGMLAVHDQAIYCVRRERFAVEKLAKKHADDPTAWQAGLRDFYADHAKFVAQTMRLPIEVAREYAAQHGTEFEAKGVVPIAGDAGNAWEHYEAGELAGLAMDGERVAA